ncbi:hypothetical protein AvCA_07100 [Azotobacter vinelandii CA]|uniref:Uncharacterized protein n=2 Tax=Azotobacter vinelandii TaxID=354 RepID=C1DLL2_AZOVD|nr:hypothetical protein Avin_07100 [Azotobacter vinelandii DJ]AGK15537.1 hypothetical protein AvCA_07100 [Azotobacter vinelandii CA]AGK19464.1 hypothetical protein AvCA6_07100 [Azotobacter vinelandii CA6]
MCPRASGLSCRAARRWRRPAGSRLENGRGTDRCRRRFGAAEASSNPLDGSKGYLPGRPLGGGSGHHSGRSAPRDRQAGSGAADFRPGGARPPAGVMGIAIRGLSLDLLLANEVCYHLRIDSDGPVAMAATRLMSLPCGRFMNS